MEVPRWLILQQEIDFRLYLLKQIAEEAEKRQPIEVLVDEATGYDQKQLKEFNKLLQEVRRLKKEFYKIAETVAI